MESKEPQSKEELKNELIDVLKNIQSKLVSYEVNKFAEFQESMKAQIENPNLKTDNPKFNEFITKFTNDNNSMKNDQIQIISKKLKMAFLYINTD
jgi:hypothetical protein